MDYCIDKLNMGTIWIFQFTAICFTLYHEIMPPDGIRLSEKLISYSIVPSFQIAFIKIYYLVKFIMSQTETGIEKPKRRRYTDKLIDEIRNRIQRGDGIIVFYLRDERFLPSLKLIVNEFTNCNTSVNVLYRLTYMSADWQEFDIRPIEATNLESYPMIPDGYGGKIAAKRFVIDVFDGLPEDGMTEKYAEEEVCKKDHVIEVNSI